MREGHMNSTSNVRSFGCRLGKSGRDVISRPSI